ncbi:DUF3386 domain-containing protein [Pseudanabaena galeata UHCC 0370]|jgi:hypothetical protein|uniref:DUF3386 domain-containing protein n=1 Tax=Pseudanabaena galeata UHCC 0370 TaxID=3110310 RepID=A0ABU5TDB4_9CYAN|nr:DUF3386 domain-containing protein [Pseudanabaena galeata]MEA5476264.1 DUF3386 domain-containing protein [Pseudanabaena galeata UHCC 0370]
MTITAERINAAFLFQTAYENRYTWDANFTGFTATAQLTQNGIVHQADVTISPELKVSVANANSSESEKAIYGQMQEIVIHRVHRSFEDVHSKNEFSYGDSDESGEVLILVGGASAGDRYKVKDKIVTMVHRHIHGTVVTINVLSTFDTGKGYLPMDYNSFYSKPNDPDSISPMQHHHDEYADFGNYFIMTSRTVSTDGDAQPQEFKLTNIVLLSNLGLG